MAQGWPTLSTPLSANRWDGHFLLLRYFKDTVTTIWFQTTSSTKCMHKSYEKKRGKKEQVFSDVTWGIIQHIFNCWFWQRISCNERKRLYGSCVMYISKHNSFRHFSINMCKKQQQTFSELAGKYWQHVLFQVLNCSAPDTCNMEVLVTCVVSGVHLQTRVTWRCWRCVLFQVFNCSAPVTGNIEVLVMCVSDTGNTEVLAMCVSGV